MAVAEAAPAQKNGPSLIVQIGLLAAMSVAAAGLGWVSGGFLAPATAGKEASAAHGGGHGGGQKQAAGHGESAVSETLVPLSPMTTNLAAPTDVWIRLEAALIVDEPQPQETIEAVHQDVLAYLRTLKLHQIESASGFQHLRADLEERAAIRSDGHVKKILIRTLLVE